MSKLRPTLWRTCRIMASETRLRLLWLLFLEEPLCVADLAKRAGLSEPNASNQLRALSARGLIVSRRKKLKVFYRPEPNTEVEYAGPLLDALRTCCDSGMTFKAVIRQATAFTHARRIVVVYALKGSSASFGELQEKTGISPAALSHHLMKLQARDFVKRINGKYRLHTPGNPFGRVLLRIVRSGPALIAPDEA